MPSKHRNKTYVENCYYHLYNRGVEKRVIFLDLQDYDVFQSYLKEYLSPKNEDELRNRLTDPKTTSYERDKILKKLRLSNFNNEIKVLAFCLMPNHFHLFVKQNNATSIHKFMQSLSTRYVMYFNHKYKRVGYLYQDIYKAVPINKDEQFIYLSKYIHKQSLPNFPSSYLDYLGQRATTWVYPQEVLSYFSKSNKFLSYKSFVEDEDLGPIQTIILEDD